MQLFVHNFRVIRMHVGRVPAATTQKHHIPTTTHTLVIVAKLVLPRCAAAYDFAAKHDPTVLDSRSFRFLPPCLITSAMTPLLVITFPTLQLLDLLHSEL